MIDLRTRYLGLDLRSPLVASASPLTGDPATALAIEEAGAGAIVLPSLFEEEIVHDEIELHRALEAGAEHYAEALDYFPPLPEIVSAGQRYVEKLQRIKERAEIPVIASLNATSAGGWIRYSRLLEEAGADALEVNLYDIAADASRSGADIEAAHLGLVAAVREAVTIPLAVKLGPYYSATAHFAHQVVTAGADGLVLFNRFYQPDLDLDTLDVVPRVDLSDSADLRLPLRWIAILRPQLRAGMSLAATSGIHRGTDAAKALLVGADVAMTTSALLRHGPAHLATIERELLDWMTEHEYESVAQMRSSASQATAEDPAAFERANYMKTLHSWAAPSVGI